MVNDDIKVGQGGIIILSAVNDDLVDKLKEGNSFKFTACNLGVPSSNEIKVVNKQLPKEANPACINAQ